MIKFTRVATLSLLLFYASVFAQECPSDMAGTFREGHWNMPDRISCEDCREVNQYPDDFRNNIWNWMLVGEGSFFYNYYMDQSISTFGSEQLSIPICNNAGQCATGTFTVIFNVLNFGIGNITIPINTSVNSITIRISQSNGDSTSDTFLPEQRDAGELPVPSDPNGTPLNPDDCLNNDGTDRSDDPPNLPGGGLPTIVSTTGWGSGSSVYITTCYMSVAHDSSGNQIGDATTWCETEQLYP